MYSICLLLYVFTFSDSASVLGQTFGMLVIQDFEAVTPNIMARIIECVEGGGIITIILPDVQSLQEIALLKMVVY